MKKLLIKEISGCEDCPFSTEGYNAFYCSEMDIDDEEWLEWELNYFDSEVGYDNVPKFHPDCPLPDIDPNPDN